jgi:hypothetical protein
MRSGVSLRIAQRLVVQVTKVVANHQCRAHRLPFRPYDTDLKLERQGHHQGDEEPCARPHRRSRLSIINEVSLQDVPSSRACCGSPWARARARSAACRSSSEGCGLLQTTVTIRSGPKVLSATMLPGRTVGAPASS